MLVTIDVGNSSTAVAVFRDGAIVFRRSLPTPRAWSWRFFTALLPAARARLVTAAIVSSVVPRLDRPLAAGIRRACALRPVFLDARTPSGLTLKIDRPAELGADRIADCAGALALFSPPLIVIDSGTAITFDLVNARREYIGGCILPGVGIAFQSLAEKTAKLKAVDLRAAPFAARDHYGRQHPRRHLLRLCRRPAAPDLPVSRRIGRQHDGRGHGRPGPLFPGTGDRHRCLRTGPDFSGPAPHP